MVSLLGGAQDAWMGPHGLVASFDSTAQAGKVIQLWGKGGGRQCTALPNNSWWRGNLCIITNEGTYSLTDSMISDNTTLGSSS